MGRNGVGEIHQVRLFQAGVRHKCLVPVEECGKLSLGQRQADHRPLRHQGHIPLLPKVILDIVVARDAGGVIVKVSVEYVGEEGAVIIHLAIAHKGFIIHLERGDHVWRPKNLHTCHCSTPLGCVRLQCRIKRLRIGEAAGVCHQDGGIGDGRQVLPHSL